MAGTQSVNKVLKSFSNSEPIFRLTEATHSITLNKSGFSHITKTKCNCNLVRIIHIFIYIKG